MAADTMHEDIREIRGMLNELIAQSARTEQKVDSLDKRLYNGGFGAIPTLFSKFDALKVSVELGVNEAKSKASEAISKVNTQHAYAAGYATGAIAILGTLKYFLGKIGLHF
jgi:hypothetical protein